MSDKTWKRGDMQKRFKRIVILLTLTILLTVGLSSVALAAEWSDLPSGVLQKYNITAEDVAGISQGFEDGTWKPDELVTRAQFTKMAVEAFGLAQATPATPSFTDVSADHQYYSWIEGAKAAGLVNGVTTTAFAPEATMTHEQCFAIVTRWVAQATKINTAEAFSPPAVAVALVKYADACSVSASLKDEVAMAVKYGIYQPGDWGNTLSPHGSVTRIEAAAALVRGMMVDGDRLVALGLAGGPPFQVNQANTGFMLVVNEEQYLIDCGGGTANNVMRAGLPYGSIHNVFFTHLHLDHYLDYVELIGRAPWAQDSPPLESITAYGPPGTEAMNAEATAFYLRGALLQNQPPIEPEAYEFDLQLGGGVVKVHEDDNVVVTATRVIHDNLSIAYAYRFDIKATGKSIVFSGDRGPGPAGTPPDDLPTLAQGADLLVHDAMNYAIPLPDPVKWTHTDVTLLPGLAKAWNVGTVVLNHYIPATMPPEAYLGMANANRNGYTGRIIAPVELDVVGF